MDYKEINRKLWNERTKHHVDSAFYNNEAFISGKSSLNKIELDLLGDLKGKNVLHLQCHFGQDSISLSRLGAEVTGVDLSDAAIAEAKKLALKTESSAKFICCDVYDTNQNVSEKFDLVFSTYGTIGWLPDMDRWAKVIKDSLKSGGKLMLVEFHPFIWMYDNDFKEISYSYFNKEKIVEMEESTYADRKSEINLNSVSWNHNLAEVISALINNGFTINNFEEYDYSPYNIFSDSIEFEKGKFRIKQHIDKLPYVYSLMASI